MSGTTVNVIHLTMEWRWTIEIWTYINIVHNHPRFSPNPHLYFACWLYTFSTLKTTVTEIQMKLKSKNQIIQKRGKNQKNIEQQIYNLCHQVKANCNSQQMLPIHSRTIHIFSCYWLQTSRYLCLFFFFSKCKFFVT